MSLLKEIDSFIQHFVQKCVQVIVQSRLGTEKTHTRCNPKGKDWFNLGINDFKDILEQTTKCLKHTSGQSSNQSLFFLKKDWKICCEILLKNSDGLSIALEYWVFTNSPLNLETDAKISHSFVCDIYLKMSNVIKSLIVLTRSLPGFKLSCKGQSADSYVICYRVFKHTDEFNDFGLSPECLKNYSPNKTVGVLDTSLNKLSLSLVYRTNMNINSESEINMSLKNDDSKFLFKDDHFKKEDDPKMLSVVQSIKPAFATTESN